MFLWQVSVNTSQYSIWMHWDTRTVHTDIIRIQYNVILEQYTVSGLRPSTALVLITNEPYFSLCTTFATKWPREKDWLRVGRKNEENRERNVNREQLGVNLWPLLKHTQSSPACCWTGSRVGAAKFSCPLRTSDCWKRGGKKPSQGHRFSFPASFSTPVWPKMPSDPMVEKPTLLLWLCATVHKSQTSNLQIRLAAHTDVL